MPNNENYVRIPRDLNNIKQKYFLGLTKRQIVFFGLGAALGFAVFFFMKDVNFTGAITTLALVVIPFGFLGMFEKNKLPFERYIKHYIRANFLRPKVRLYKSQNIYTALQDKIYFDKEVKRVGYERSVKDKIIAAFEAADKIKPLNKTKHKG